MSHYSDNEGAVRVDFFRESGKWIATESIDMTGFYFGRVESVQGRKEKAHLLPAAIIEAIRSDETMHARDGSLRYAGSWAVCLDPYHEFSYPQMFKLPER
jgi:hypothetical protein